MEQQQSQERRHQLADVTFDGWQCHPQHSQLFPLPLGVVGMRELPYFGWQRKALPLPVPSTSLGMAIPVLGSDLGHGGR